MKETTVIENASTKNRQKKDESTIDEFHVLETFVYWNDSGTSWSKEFLGAMHKNRCEDFLGAIHKQKCV